MGASLAPRRAAGLVSSTGLYQEVWWRSEAGVEFQLGAGGMGHLWKDRSVRNQLWTSRERPGREDRSFREERSFGADSLTPTGLDTAWGGPGGTCGTQSLTCPFV